MTEEKELPEEDFDEQAVASFGERLQKYAETLDAKEQKILLTMLYRAMDPLERIRWDAKNLLSEEEEEALKKLNEKDED
jgi:hypothetical protein